jgi:hypothetical protein
MRRAAAARLSRMRPQQSSFGKILLGMRRSACAGALPSLACNRGCQPRFASAKDYTPKVLHVDGGAHVGKW